MPPDAYMHTGAYKHIICQSTSNTAQIERRSTRLQSSTSGSGGVLVPGGIQEMSGHSTQCHGLVKGFGSQVDGWTYDLFQPRQFYDFKKLMLRKPIS